MLNEEGFNQELAQAANHLAEGRAAFRPLARGIEMRCDGVRSHLDTRELYRAYAAGLPATEPIVEIARTLVAQSEGIAEVIGQASDFAFARHHLYPQFLPQGTAARRGVGFPWMTGLDLGYVLDSDDWWQLVVVTDDMRRAWGIGQGALLDVALENLATGMVPPTCVVPGRAYAFTGGDRPHLNAVQVLLPEQMQHVADLCEERRLQVEVPLRGFAAVYVAGEEEAEQRVRHSLTGHAGRHAYRLSRIPYIWEAGHWTTGRVSGGGGERRAR